MRWLPFIVIFSLAYIEISLFIKVAAVLGVAITLLLIIFTSCVGISLVRNQGIKTLIQMRQRLATGESPAQEMVKSVSLILAGFLLLIPGFFTDFLGLLLLLPLVQKLLIIKLMPHLNIYSSATTGSSRTGEIFDGEYQRKDDVPDRLEKRQNDKE
ncbi:FxsA family protein [Candidatus Regiella insecticola]|uniref:Suppressor of F exclusion of phage T7 n=1 Tax=Candidatus Regiella insecticola TaxID=138073 RepID=A0A6L2ZPW9_9ENTR|nr:FxsA family protein [Candidatus Regiella insecticola]GFN46569.1 suppressor of F exclusion of phage T7 [Candidatus Regiella insecticola]